jgi:hypothetical protein
MAHICEKSAKQRLVQTMVSKITEKTNCFLKKHSNPNNIKIANFLHNTKICMDTTLSLLNICLNLLGIIK